MRKESPLIMVWDNGTLVGLSIHCPTATCPSPTRTEQELVRIFNEHAKLAVELTTANDENKRLRDALQGLYDAQNGPPLARREKSWQASMDKAVKLL